MTGQPEAGQGDGRAAVLASSRSQKAHRRGKASDLTLDLSVDERLDEGFSAPSLTPLALGIIGLINLVDCINDTIMQPYVQNMVARYLELPKDDPRVASDVGFVVGVYHLCEVIFPFLWGYWADRYGRRPVLLVGLVGSACAPLMLGLSTSMPMIYISRMVDGFFCGNLGVAKTYLGELVDRSNEAYGFSVLVVTYALGLAVGPSIGGFFAEPAKSWDSFRGTLFETYPYLLPNLVYSLVVWAGCVVAALTLRETLPPSQRLRNRCLGTAGTGTEWSEIRNLTKNSSFMITTTSYALQVAYFTVWLQNFVLVAQVPAESGGYDLRPSELASCQNMSSIGLLLTGVWVYPRLVDWLGYHSVYSWGWAVNLAATLPFPIYALGAGQDYGYWRLVPLAMLLLLGYSGGGCSYSTIFVWINRSVPSTMRGRANGIVNSCQALAAGVAPPIFGAIFGYGTLLHPRWGGFVAVYLACLFPAACLVMVEHLPSSFKGRPMDDDEDTVSEYTSTEEVTSDLQRTGSDPALRSPTDGPKRRFRNSREPQREEPRYGPRGPDGASSVSLPLPQ